MGLIDDVRGQRICIDTAPIIYFIEHHVKYREMIRPVFAEIASGNIEAITSTISLLEVLVHPLRTGEPPAPLSSPLTPHDYFLKFFEWSIPW